MNGDDERRQRTTLEERDERLEAIHPRFRSTASFIATSAATLFVGLGLAAFVTAVGLYAGLLVHLFLVGWRAAQWLVS